MHYEAKIAPYGSKVRQAVQKFTVVDHLNPEAIAAYVDNELSAAAARRARMHFEQCVECCTEVKKQMRASQRLRSGCKNMHASSELIAKLQVLAEDAACHIAEEPAQRDSFFAKFRGNLHH